MNNTSLLLMIYYSFAALTYHSMHLWMGRVQHDICSSIQDEDMVYNEDDDYNENDENWFERKKKNKKMFNNLL